MNTSRLLFATMALSILLTASPGLAEAGEIDPALARQLSGLADSEEVTALFLLDRQADLANLDRALKLGHATRKERHRRVIEALQATARESQPAFLAELDRRSRMGEVTMYSPHWITNLVAVRATRAAIEELAGRSDVALVGPGARAGTTGDLQVESRASGRVEQDGSVRQNRDRRVGVTPGLRAIHAPRVWYELGINGSGTIVANLDTGVDGNHPALRDRWRGNNGHPWPECWHDVLGGGTQVPVDPSGHGTHVMGTMAGLGASTQDSIGVAWGAQWIAANAINQGIGTEFEIDVLECFQWFADPDGNPNTVDDVPDVIQNSWGVNESLGYPDCAPVWWAAIDACEAAGAVVLWSAGGDGPASGTIRSPADRATTEYNCFSIGTVDATNYEFPYPIASFSSRGPTGCDVPDPLKIKPEVVAPGVQIYSSIPGTGYAVWSGSAMSGPHVAGVVALMRSADPDVDVDTIKDILMRTARDEGVSGEDNTYGWGFIDAYEAMIRIPTSAVGEAAGRDAGLVACRPNPFSREARLRFRISDGGAVTLGIYDPGGRLVRTLVRGPVTAGEHAATWDGRDDSGRRMPAGAYFARMTSGSRRGSGRLILIR